MKPHIPDGVVLFFSLVVLILYYPALASADTEHRRIHVNNAVGNDSNSGMTETEPVTSSQGRWLRVSELGVMGADTGIAVKNVTDTPGSRWVCEVMRRKPDYHSHTDTPVEVIAGHGAMPTGEVEESEMTNLRVRRRYNWEIRTAPHGQLYEHLVSIPETVEAY